MKKKDLQELWKNYKNSDEKDKLYYRNKLIEYYYNYVQQIAWKMGEKLNWNVTHDELTSFGIDGLIHAIKKFDLKKNINFKAYANQRIKGSMIDGIRREDKIPRSVRLKQSHIQKIKKKLEEQKQREVTEKEVIDYMGINYITYHKNYKKYNPSVYYSIENFSDDENNDFKQDSNYNLIDKNYKYPEKKVIQKEFFNKLLSSGFTLLERKIILLYYYDKCTMREISDTLDISESRICQICKNVLSRLKNKIKRNPFYFKEYLK